MNTTDQDNKLAPSIDSTYMRDEFGKRFPSSIGLWRDNLNNGHGGYACPVHQSHWIGWCAALCFIQLRSIKI